MVKEKIRSVIVVICSICGKKQSSFIEDFPLFNLPDARICTVCNDHKNALEQYCKQDFSRYCVERGYFTNLIETSAIQPNALNRLKETLTNFNAIAESFQDNLMAVEDKKQQEISEQLKIYENFSMTNGFNFEGFGITKYHKVICAEIILGTGFLSEFSAGFADFFGVESEKMGSKFEEARESVLLKLTDKALSLQANAIIGLNFNYAPIAGNMIALTVNGTAVTIVRNQ